MPTDVSTTSKFPNLVLRPPQPTDQSAINQLYHACRTDLHTLLMPNDMLINLTWQQQQIQAHGISLHYPTAQTLLLAQAEKILARVIFDIGNTDIRLIDIMVLPMVQRHGLARQLLRYLQKLAAEQQLPLRLSVMKDNSSAIALYLSCGFQVSQEDYLAQHMHWQTQVTNNLR